MQSERGKANGAKRTQKKEAKPINNAIGKKRQKKTERTEPTKKRVKRVHMSLRGFFFLFRIDFLLVFFYFK